MNRVARFAWAVLIYNVAVILWGAYVRATGSGAGCGSHWPLCNGVLVQRGATAATLIEYSHRITSGFALVIVVGLLAWTWRATRPGHPARTGAVLSVVFMLSEAAVGAGLVLFQLVAENASAARAMFMGVHLLNTFVLLACLSLTATWLSADPVREGGWHFSGRGAGHLVAIAAGCVLLLLASSSGAVAALGDTLFPNATLAEALRADLSATSHLLIRLRIFHPMLAALAVLVLVGTAWRMAGDEPVARSLAHLLGVAATVQIVLGILNVLLLAPVWLQLTHLLVADIVWISFVLLSAAALAVTDTTPVAEAR